MLREFSTGAAIALVLSACAYVPSAIDLRNCGEGDTRPWQRTEDVPGNADELRRIANSTAFDPPGKDEVETWFTLPGGEVMLCRTPNDRSGEWWQFEQSDEGPRLTGHNGWDIITVMGS